MREQLRIFVPRLVDSDNLNAQNLNARAMLIRFADPRAYWIATHYNEPDPRVAASRRLELHRLWRRRFWTSHLALMYQRKADGIFYPGPERADVWGLEWRRLTAHRVPVVATLEGVLGDEQQEKRLSAVAGHEVYCQRVAPGPFRRAVRVLQYADHVIAISPFLGKLGRHLYGEKFSVLPLGFDTTIFHAHNRIECWRPRVVSAGTVKVTKRPKMFLDLAARSPEADFVWFGSGELLEVLRAEVLNRGLKNIEFAGPRSQSELAHEFRSSTVFVLTSVAEGVPKVTQEAAACGLPVVLFGFFESPSVVHRENGYVVWSDDELHRRVKQIVADPRAAATMGQRGAEMAKAWDWDLVAPTWEEEILGVLSRS
jgi:glycosyltransferase involved in cell wall biosynthesis